MRRLAVPLSAVALLLAGSCKRADTPPPPPPDEAPTADAPAPDPTASDPPPSECATLELEACAEQGAALLVSDTPERAVPLLTWACGNDHADACATLASSYRAGHLPSPGASEVHALNLRGCAAGSPHSCTLLGADYYEGEAVDKDVNKATELLTQACEQDERQACALARWTSMA
ncbi:tetratricopeptide repeat protein [Enhygromyxa salina]|uniref:Beta-lactamase HcpA n=1 Tax=Enhygromyxa salina TaxID=215803 RepID=A0A2S9Y895_9BACT|nr:sel1 repeat family protein [Enhygromyxa salina]PRQ01241.1 Beta-lactamase HcpA precursor [Enhygromyxa salina]